MSREYRKFNYPDSVKGAETFVTGIRKVNCSNSVYISGVYRPPCEGSSGLVYKGDLCGKGKWYQFNYPSDKCRKVTGTSFYGPNNGPDGTVQVVGSYNTKEAGETPLGLLYEGDLKGCGEWTTIIPPSTKKVIGTIVHSTHGGLAVGNYEVEYYEKNRCEKECKKIKEARAFIYDIECKKFYKIKIPCSTSVTAYGIWHNGCDSYTICGGYASSVYGQDKPISYGYIVEFDKKKLCFQNFRSYQFQDCASVTHFNGITSDGKDGYNLTGDAVTTLLGPKHPKPVEVAFFAHVKSLCKDADWEVISYPCSKVIFGNSVYEKTVIGVYTSQHDNLNSYIAS